MNKVKLHLEDLQVESFAVEAPAAEVGTVHGRQVHAESGVGTPWTCGSMCCPSLYQTNCPGDDTCQSQYVSCRYTECPDVNTCYETGCGTSYYTECTCDYACLTEVPAC